MPLASMTGFARVDGTHGDTRWTWEIRSVNGKGLDVRLRLPAGRDHLDTSLRALARKKLARGNVSATLSMTRETAVSSLKLNEAALETVIAIADQISHRVHAAPPTVDGLMALKGVLEIADPEESEDERAASDAAITDGFTEALDRLISARNDEGAALGEILGNHVDEIERLAEKAEIHPDRTLERIKTRLAEQLAALLDADNRLEPQRLHQEAAILATKADIREELDRLRAHIDAARALLSKGAVVGRKFDFLSQEFNREVNTLCSKSNSVELTAIGLDMKAVVDQLREQIQNLE